MLVFCSINGKNVHAETGKCFAQNVTWNGDATWRRGTREEVQLLRTNAQKFDCGLSYWLISEFHWLDMDILHCVYCQLGVVLRLCITWRVTVCVQLSASALIQSLSVGHIMTLLQQVLVVERSPLRFQWRGTHYRIFYWTQHGVLTALDCRWKLAFSRCTYSIKCVA